MLYTQRVFWLQYNTPEKLARILDFWERHRSLCHEISFFTESDGCDLRWLPDGEVQRRAEWMQTVVKQTRAHGFGVAINILQTMGHADDGVSDAPGIPWQGITDPKGTVARQCSCPRDKDFLEYVKKKYRAFASCGADRYWIDDDLRMHNHKPVTDGCYCNSCLNSFAGSEGLGEIPDRDAFIKQLQSDTELEQAWRNFGQSSILQVIRFAADAILEAHPGAEIGLMTCGPDDHRADLDVINEAGASVQWLRPGGGFWTENQPRDLVGKIATVSIATTSMQREEKQAYEIENYPYCEGAKSARMTALDCLLQTLAGNLDGLMFNLIDSIGNDPALQEGWMRRLADWQPVLAQAAENVAGTRPAGWRTLAPEMELLSMGLPLTAASEDAVGTILNGSSAAKLTPEDWEALFEKPLVLDGDAATIAFANGFGQRIGLRSITCHHQGVSEVFAEHPVNGAYAGYRRGFTLPYFDATSHVLELLPQAVEISEAQVAINGQRLGSSSSLFRPANAAPVAILGHAPWKHILTAPRIHQMRTLFESMQSTASPLEIVEPVACALWLRADVNGKPTIASICNTSQETMTLNLRGKDSKISPIFVTEHATATKSSDQLTLALPPWTLAVCKITSI